MKRIVFAFLGLIALSLGVAGYFLPLLPGTPFLLLALFCFAQSSGTLYQWLFDHPLFGASLRDYVKTGKIKKRTKIAALLLMNGSIAISLLVVRVPLILSVILIILGIIGNVVLFFLPTQNNKQR